MESWLDRTELPNLIWVSPCQPSRSWIASTSAKEISGDSPSFKKAECASRKLMSSRSLKRAAREIIRLSGLGAVEWGLKVRMPTGMPLTFPANWTEL